MWNKNLKADTGKSDIEQEAEKYAERVCNGIFPIEYTRQQVVDHTKGDVLYGYSWAMQRVLACLKENYEACKTLVDEDKARSAQDIVNETYEDMIAIFISDKFKTK